MSHCLFLLKRLSSTSLLIPSAIRQHVFLSPLAQKFKLNSNLCRYVTTTTPTKTTIELSDYQKIQLFLLKNQKENILIFSSNSKFGTKVKKIGMFVFLLLSGIEYFLFLLHPEAKLNINNVESGLFKDYLEFIYSDSFTNVSTFIHFALGLSVFISSFFFSRSLVRRIYLLKGSNRLSVITNGYFGKRQHHSLKLDEIVFKQTRSDPSKLLKFKSRKDYLNFIIDKREGIFHEKLLFDKYICRVIIK
jgi:hypothetical protein